MGNVKKGRIRIDQQEDHVKISWNRVDGWYVVGIIVLPLSFIAVAGSWFGLTYLFGYQIITLSLYQQLCFWILWIGLLYLVIFNRKTILTADRDQISLRRGRFPSMTSRIATRDVAEIAIQPRKDLGLAESDGGLSRGPFYRVMIYSGKKPVIRTDYFPKEEADAIMSSIKGILRSTLNRT